MHCRQRKLLQSNASFDRTEINAIESNRIGDRGSAGDVDEALDLLLVKHSSTKSSSVHRSPSHCQPKQHRDGGVFQFQLIGTVSGATETAGVPIRKIVTDPCKRSRRPGTTTELRLLRCKFAGRGLNEVASGGRSKDEGDRKRRQAPEYGSLICHLFEKNVQNCRLCLGSLSLHSPLLLEDVRNCRLCPSQFTMISSLLLLAEFSAAKI